MTAAATTARRLYDICKQTTRLLCAATSGV
jgi:hypothetical protein